MAGVRAKSKFTGELKGDVRLIDGVVDNGVGVWESGSMLSIDGQNQADIRRIRTVGCYPLNPNETYSFVFDDINFDIGIYEYEADKSYIQATVWITSSGTILSNALSAKQRVTIRYKDNRDMVASDIINVGLKIFKGIIEPPSQTYAIGNSVIQDTTKNTIVEASIPLTTEMYDISDIDNPIPQVIPIANIVANENDQWFSTFDENGNLIKQGFYSKDFSDPEDEECLQAIERAFQTTELLLEQSGSGLIDADNIQLIVPQV